MSLLVPLRAFGYPPWPLLFAVAGVGLAASAFPSGSATLAAICAQGAALPADGWADAARSVLAVTPPGRLLADWSLMLLAMMPPLLAVPLMHVWRSSLPRRRAGALASFILGYVAVWLAMGPVLIAAAFVLQAATGEAAFLAALLIAAVWSASPWQRRALNRAHRLPRIGLFGWPALRDALAFGAVHAAWCVASCWAWMLAPLTAGRWHLVAMALAGFVMLVERLARPDRPRWRAPQLVASALALRWSLQRG